MLVFIDKVGAFIATMQAWFLAQPRPTYRSPSAPALCVGALVPLDRTAGDAGALRAAFRALINMARGTSGV